MKMTKFKEHFETLSFLRPLQFPSVSVTFNAHTLYFRFDNKDVVVEASYTGEVNPWISSLCFLSLNKSMAELKNFDWKTWDNFFREDQAYWDHREEEDVLFINKHFELLHAALDIYRGRDYLYKIDSPLVCRCFGVREKDILEFFQKEATPTLDSLMTATKAGMGCRSCVPQMARWLETHPKKNSHFYKDRSHADWLLDIDYMVSCFPKALEWKMEIASFKGTQVVIKFEKEVSQREEEQTAKELQDFLAASVDSDLGFFLIRDRHLSKALR